MRRSIPVVALQLATAITAAAQTRTLPPAVNQFVKVNGPTIAIVHAKVVDGTGAPAKTDQTILIRGETIVAVGAASRVSVPEDATVVDATGKSVIPGLIGLHDHMYYGGMKLMGDSYPRLFLSAGVTTSRTTGSDDSHQELNV